MPRPHTIAAIALAAAGSADAFAPSVLRSTRLAQLASAETDEWSAPAMPGADGAVEELPDEVAVVQKAPRTSLALPFMKAPAVLDGSLAGDMVSFPRSSHPWLRRLAPRSRPAADRRERRNGPNEPFGLRRLSSLPRPTPFFSTPRPVP